MNPVGFSKEKFSKALQENGIDVMIVTSPENVFYTSGLPSRHAENNPILFSLSNNVPTMVIIDREGEESLITWAMMDPELTWIEDFHGILSMNDALDNMLSIMKEKIEKKAKIGVESTAPFYLIKALRENFPDSDIVDIDDIILNLRLIKTEEEIERIRKSTEIAENTILRLFDELKEGIDDLELLKIAKKSIIEEGAEGWDHVTLGIADSDPEAPGRGIKVKRGDVVRFDIGAIYKGYTSDVSRHAVIGEPLADARKIIEDVADVLMSCAESIEPGIPTMDILSKAQEEFEKKGNDVPIFPICHSIGLRCEELHLFDPIKSADRKFEENMVFDLEFWVPYEKYNNRLIGMEDTFLLKKEGCERISKIEDVILVK